jgi:ABC-type multidrug transport system fused ATPase/permease subunit
LLRVVYLAIIVIGVVLTFLSLIQPLIPALRLGPDRFELCLVLTIVFIVEGQGLRAAKELIKRVHRNFEFVGEPFTADYRKWTSRRRTRWLDVAALLFGLFVVAVLFHIHMPFESRPEEVNRWDPYFLASVNDGVHAAPVASALARSTHTSVGNEAATFVRGICLAGRILAGAAIALAIACVAVVLALVDILRKCTGKLRGAHRSLYDNTEGLSDVMLYYLLCTLTTLLVFSMWFYIWPVLFGEHRILLISFNRIAWLPVFAAIILIVLAYIGSYRALLRAHNKVKSRLEEELRQLNDDLDHARRKLLEKKDNQEFWEDAGEYFRRAEAVKEKQFKIHRIESFEKAFTAGAALSVVIAVWVLIAVQKAEWTDMLLGPAALAFGTWLIGSLRRHKTKQSGIVDYVLPIQ